MPRKTKAAGIPAMLTNETVPLDHRCRLLRHMCSDDSEETTEMLGAFLQRVKEPADPKNEYAKKVEEYENKLRELESGPMRQGTYLGILSGNGSSQAVRACVALEDGSRAFVFVPEPELAKSLVRGETVLIEANGKALLRRETGLPETGEKARLERVLDEHLIEVCLRDHENHVFLASATLARRIADGEVGPGASLLVCPRRMVAFVNLPVEDGLSHFRFLDRQPVPDMNVERDLADPPAYIEELVGQVRMEMLRPEERRRFRLPRCAMRFLFGVSGSGKTFSLMAFERRVYELMAEITGEPIEALPRRVLRLRPGQYLSKWLGEADKNLERFFDEVEQIANEPFEASDGVQYDLPVLVILEEVDGLARGRGEEAIYDRIMTTALQRLDPSRPELRDSFVLFLGTSNVPHQCDHAFVRRLSGRVERFGRLSRAAFAAVLGKKLAGLPVEGKNGADPRQREQALVAEVCGWLFRPEAKDRPLVEITFAGSTTPCRKYRRDFLTAGLVDRAVQQASLAACEAGYESGGEVGLTAPGLVTALEEQIRAVADLMKVNNAHDYVDLPDAVHVATLRRVEQPDFLPHELLGVN